MKNVGTVFSTKVLASCQPSYFPRKCRSGREVTTMKNNVRAVSTKMLVSTVLVSVFLERERERLREKERD